MGDLDPQLREARRADVVDLAESFTRAFEDDPAFSWIFPDRSTRARRLGLYFRTLLAHEGIDHGVSDVAIVGTRIVGGSIWFRPGEWPPPISRQLRELPAQLLAFRGRLGVATTWVR
ncbi:MAG: hypothetical protein ACRDYY_01515, partial [Acidimicrobiales bacterium]